MSTDPVRTRAPIFASSDPVSSINSLPRAQIARSASSFANSIAAALPIPLLAPVTRTTLEFNPRSILLPSFLVSDATSHLFDLDSGDDIVLQLLRQLDKQ